MDNRLKPRSKRRCLVDQEVKTTSGPEKGNIAKQRKSSKKGEDLKDVRLVSKGKLWLGDHVTVCWDGYNYNCKVVGIEDKRVKVHYLNWSSGYDEWVALSGTSHEDDSTVDGEDSAGVPPQTKKRKIQAATSKDGESAARMGHHEVEEMAELLKRSAIDLVPSLPPTKGDGNCWFRSIASQAKRAGLPSRFSDHRQLRLEVAEHMKQLPEDISANIVDTVFRGNKRGLRNLAFRQAQDGQ